MVERHEEVFKRLMFMSESIWDREIEEGLKNFLNTFLLYSSGVNEGSPIPVKVRKPDDDFGSESYPVIYLQSLQQRLNTVRYDPTDKVISRSTATNTMVVEEAPLPFDCTYQVGFYTQSRNEINSMVQKFLAHTHGGRYFNLPAKDQSGNDWDLFVIRRNGGTVSRGYHYDSVTRMYQATYSFEVHTQLNENVRHVKYMTSGVEAINVG